LLQDSLNYEFLISADSIEGRTLTVNKLTDNVLDINSQMAWIQTQSLHSYIPNVFDLNEARRITQFATRVYKKLLQVYQKRAPGLTPTTVKPSDTESCLEMRSLLWLNPTILTQIAYDLEPILLVFQEQLLASKDWRALGFMTTQLKFTNKLILSYLTPVETLLLGSYLKFVEEQVAMPWQRVCVAAATHELGSQALTVVEHMIPVAEEIAQNVHYRLVQLFPNYNSRSGWFADPEVAHSSIRDLNMFQSYLWLCVLEQSLIPIEQELIKLCLMVLECIEVKWEIAEVATQLLTEELFKRLSLEHRSVLLPYTQGLQQAFVDAR
jgi:hypothetical protein